jgi:hypothetical protein
MTMKAILTTGTLLVLAAALAMAADDKPNLSGTWKLNTDKSNFFGKGVPSALSVTIDHKDPVFKYSVSGSQDGNDFEESGEVTIGGKDGTSSNGLTLKAHWDGRVLVVEYSSPDGSFSGLAHDKLSDDGKTLTRDAEVKSSEGDYKQHIVLEKQ